jgi:hypothetical protein
VIVGNPAGLQLPTTFSIEGWVQLTAPLPTAVTSDPGADGNAMLFGFGLGGYGFAMNSSGQLFLEQVGGSQATPSSSAIADTDWHHVAVTYDSGTGTYAYYIDGAPAGGGSSYSPTFTFATYAAIGGRADKLNAPGNASFAGAIDELSVYKVVLTSAQVLGIYDAQGAGKCFTAPTYNAVSGSVQLYKYLGSGPQAPGTANFVATDASGVVATWYDAVLTPSDPASSDTWTYSLGQVPATTTHISVLPTRPPYYLRKKLPAVFSPDPLNFTGGLPPAGYTLWGGDLNGDGKVDTLDYIILIQNWGSSSPLADMNGDGIVDAHDYTIMESAWYHTADPEVTTDGGVLKGKSSDPGAIHGVKAVKEQSSDRE